MKRRLALFVGLSVLLASVLIAGCQAVAESNEKQAAFSPAQQIPVYPGATEVSQTGNAYTYASTDLFGEVLAWYDRQRVMDRPDPTPTSEDSRWLASTRLIVKYKETEFAVTVRSSETDDGRTYVDIVKQ